MASKLIIKNNEACLMFISQNAEPSDCISSVIAALKQQNLSIIYAKMPNADLSSVLIAEIYQWKQKLIQEGIELKLDYLPQEAKDLLLLSLKPANIPPTVSVYQVDFLIRLGRWGYKKYSNVLQVLKFLYEVFLSVITFVLGRAIYRRRDFWFIFEDCSYKSVGITALVSFLVGLILAFVGALQLKNFGAGIYVASMVTLGMTRIMAAIMVGIIMAGRTGSSYAATLGTMQVNEEIDALKTLGIKITEYLVVPRLICLVVTIPFLTLLADVLGILGGAVVGVVFLDISAAAYFDYALKALNLTNILVGLLHSLIYGLIISLCGCYEGLTAGRDADAVGKATTQAVVTALIWMIVATGILTVLLEIIGL